MRPDPQAINQAPNTPRRAEGMFLAVDDQLG
jgi:hypothetical protein